MKISRQKLLSDLSEKFLLNETRLKFRNFSFQFESTNFGQIQIFHPLWSNLGQTGVTFGSHLGRLAYL